MKTFFTILFSLCISGIFSGQEKALLKILNRELKNEVKNQFKSPNFDEDPISIVKPFTITNHLLSFEIKKKNPHNDGYQLIKQEVPLKMIRRIGKDLQIILETEPKSVITTYTNIPSNYTETIEGNLFFLYLFNEKQNDDLGVQLQSAFVNAGYAVEKDYWYD